MGFWWVLGLSIHLASIIPQKTCPNSTPKKNTHTPHWSCFSSHFSTHTTPQKKKTPPPPPKKTPAPPPPPPQQKNTKTQKAANKTPNRPTNPFGCFFFLTPLSTWIVTWRGNAAATGDPSHLRHDVVGVARGQRGWGGEVERGSLKWRNLQLVKLDIDTAYVREWLVTWMIKKTWQQAANKAFLVIKLYVWFRDNKNFGDKFPNLSI